MLFLHGLFLIFNIFKLSNSLYNLTKLSFFWERLANPKVYFIYYAYARLEYT